MFKSVTKCIFKKAKYTLFMVDMFYYFHELGEIIFDINLYDTSVATVI